MKLLVATDKGLIEYVQKDESWVFSHLFFDGLPVSCFHEDVEGHWWVTIRHLHWGVKIFYSKNQGTDFTEVSTPKFKPPKKQLKSIWEIQSRWVNGTKQVFLGTEPAALFLTSDQGKSFQQVEGLEAHPSRQKWQGGGKGSINPFLHTLLFHPERQDEWLIGISCAGVFCTKDAGSTWESRNKGLSSPFLPDAYADVGHDPHSIQRHPLDPNLLWQQNHCGVYISNDNAENWKELSDNNSGISYGFALTIDELDPASAWIMPVSADDKRVPLQHKLCVYHTTNYGKKWKNSSQGLPETAAFDVVLRKSFVKKEQHMAFGTNHGNLYVSNDKGLSWNNLSHHLSKITALYPID